MESFLWHVAEYLIVGGLGYALGCLHNQWKPIYFRVSEWTVKYALPPTDSGELLYSMVPSKEKSAYCHFDLLWFNKKSDAVGLHEVTLDFQDVRGKTLFKMRSPTPSICNVDLPPHETATLVGDVAIMDDNYDLLPQCRSIHLVANSTEGSNKKRKWLVAHYKYPLGETLSVK